MATVIMAVRGMMMAMMMVIVARRHCGYGLILGNGRSAEFTTTRARGNGKWQHKDIHKKAAQHILLQNTLNSGSRRIVIIDPALSTLGEYTVRNPLYWWSLETLQPFW